MPGQPADEIRNLRIDALDSGRPSPKLALPRVMKASGAFSCLS